LRSTDFRRIYDRGRKFTCPLFAAFCEQEAGLAGPRIGFTTPRALGNSVARNRIKRRMREAVRLRLDHLNPQWSIVINPRRKTLEAPFPELEREVERLFRQVNAW
jgi:ribonuclease P protein component